MSFLKGIFSELLALFVDDGSFVLTVLARVLGAVICFRNQLLDPAFEAVLLFLGIAIILAENVARTARAHISRTPGVH